MQAGTVIHGVRADKQWSQRELARRCGVAQPSISDIESGERDTTVGKLEQILRPAGYRLVAIPTTRPTVADWAAELKVALQDDPGAVEKSLVQLGNDLQGAESASCVALCLTPPPPTGSTAIDAVLAAIVEYLLSRRDLPVPAWVHTTSRTSIDEWDLVDIPSLRAVARQETPEPFRRRNVFVPADFFLSA